MSESTELAVIKKDPRYKSLPADVKKAVEEHLFAPPELDEGDLIGDSRWSPVFVKLVQKMPDFDVDNIKLGDLIGKGKLEKPVKIIPLVIWQSRAKWGAPGTEHAGQMMCKSPDSKTPSMANAWGAKSCAGCKYASKSVSRDEKCKISINIAALAGDFRNVYVFQFTGSSYMTGLNIYKTLKGQNPLFQLAFLLNVQKKTNRGVTWYQYVIEGIDRTPEGLFPVLEQCKIKMVEYVKGLMSSGTSADELGSSEAQSDSDGETTDSGSEPTKEEIEKAKAMGIV